MTGLALYRSTHADWISGKMDSRLVDCLPRLAENFTLGIATLKTDHLPWTRSARPAREMTTSSFAQPMSIPSTPFRCSAIPEATSGFSLGDSWLPFPARSSQIASTDQRNGTQPSASRRSPVSSPTRSTTQSTSTMRISATHDHRTAASVIAKRLAAESRTALLPIGKVWSGVVWPVSVSASTGKPNLEVRSMMTWWSRARSPSR